jgi:hypothetical protein
MCERTHVKINKSCTCTLLPEQIGSVGCVREFAYSDQVFVDNEINYRGTVSENGHIICDPTSKYYNLRAFNARQHAALECQQQIKRQIGRGIFRFVGLQQSSVAYNDPFLELISHMYTLPEQLPTETYNMYMKGVREHAALFIANQVEQFVRGFSGSVEMALSKYCKYTIEEGRFVIPLEIAMVELYTPMNKCPTFAKPGDLCGNKFHTTCFNMIRGNAHVCRGLMPRLLLALFVQRLNKMAYYAALGGVVIRESFTGIPRRPSIMPRELFDNVLEYSDVLYDRLGLGARNSITGTHFQAQVIPTLFTNPGEHKYIMPCILQILQTAVMSGRHLKYHDRITVGVYLGSIFSKAQLPYVFKLLEAFFLINGVDDAIKNAAEIKNHANTSTTSFSSCSTRYSCPYKSLGGDCVDICIKKSGRTLPTGASKSSKAWSPQTIARLKIEY